ncbi:MAG: hypothetical protein AAF493_02045 [Pseudomonadota bacterium]
MGSFRAFQRVTVCAWLLVGCFMGSTATRAESVVVEVAPGDLTATFFFSAASGPLFVIGDVSRDIPDVSRFDSTMGALTNISFHLEGIFDWSANISGDGLPSQPTSASATMPLAAMVRIESANGPATLVQVTDTATPMCSGDGIAPCDDDQASLTEVDAVDNGGNAFSELPLDAFVQRSAADPFVAGLHLMLDAPAPTFSLTNLTDAEADVRLTLSDIELAVTYEFTPIPLPVAWVLFASAGLVAAVVRRRAPSGRATA